MTNIKINNNEIKNIEMNTYETNELISQYLEFHYGDEYFGVKNFPKTCIDTIFDKTSKLTFNRALDLGCAVGRSSFELAKKIESVEAIDYSENFIKHAKTLAEQGSIIYSITDEGDLSSEKHVSLKKLGLQQTVKRVEFSQGDASNLKSQQKDYDLIFAGNLIDRLEQPKEFLTTIHQRINTDGLLVLTSPYTWLEEFTPKQNWIGGYRKDGQRDGQNVSTLDGLHKILNTHFDEYVEPIDIPFVIRETARKHQHTVAQMTFWIKK